MKKGFTLVEMMVVVGMMAIIVSIGAMSLRYTQINTHMSVAVVKVKDALNQAQARTLNGRQTTVYFEADRFTVFNGIIFNPADPDNEETVLDSGLSFSAVNFPSGLVIYDAVTGYPSNYAVPYNVVLQETASGTIKTISVNQIGVVEVQ